MCKGVSNALSLDLGGQVFKHHIHKLLQAKLMSPPPVLASLAVIDRVGPRVGDLLAVVRPVLHLQRQVLADGRGELAHAETDGCEVVAGAHPDGCGVGLHESERSGDCVLHEDHGQRGLLAHEALVPAGGERRVEDGYSVVRGAAAGQLLPADDAGVAQTAHIQPVLGEVVLPEQFAGVLGDSVHRGGLDAGVLRRGDLRRGGPEDRHRARPEDAAHLELDAEVEEGLERAQVHLPALLRVLLAAHGQHGRQVVYLRELVLQEHLPQPRAVRHVRPLQHAREALGDPAVPERHHAAHSVEALQFGDELGAHLPEGASHQDLFRAGLHAD